MLSACSKHCSEHLLKHHPSMVREQMLEQCHERTNERTNEEPWSPSRDNSPSVTRACTADMDFELDEFERHLTATDERRSDDRA